MPPSERAKLLQRAVLDEDEDRWRLADRGGGGALIARRPVSAVGERRPVSEYARLAGSVHGGTRYKVGVDCGAKGGGITFGESDWPAAHRLDTPHEVGLDGVLSRFIPQVGIVR